MHIFDQCGPIILRLMKVTWLARDHFIRFEAQIDPNLLYASTTRVTRRLLTPLPQTKRKTKDIFINLRSNHSELFTVRVQPFFRPFQTRLEERKKLHFWKGPQRRPNINDQLPFESKLPFPVCFLSSVSTVTAYFNTECLVYSVLELHIQQWTLSHFVGKKTQTRNSLDTKKFSSHRTACNIAIATICGN